MKEIKKDFFHLKINGKASDTKMDKNNLLLIWNYLSNLYNCDFVISILFCTSITKKYEFLWLNLKVFKKLIRVSSMHPMQEDVLIESITSSDTMKSSIFPCTIEL